ncbi:hypothetical protein E2C01_045787 [Portunus trituberculatus]|uniref:Uncharacterized protein n=1 Tax=Portunus trituberculatus TaxID=210409 RepID=A0A5B7FW26_PORTR|nr:hypothetical protein [Portunus trituberculatus]
MCPCHQQATPSQRCDFQYYTNSIPFSVCMDSEDTSASPSPVESKRFVHIIDMCAAVVIGDQYIGPTCVQKVSVSIRNAPVGSCVLSYPDSVRVQRLTVEGTLSSVRDDHFTDALVNNLTGSFVTLRNGVHLGFVDEAFFRNPTTLITAEFLHSMLLVVPLEELATQLETHIKVVDYPEVRIHICELLDIHREAIALAG